MIAALNSSDPMAFNIRDTDIGHWTLDFFQGISTLDFGLKFGITPQLQPTSPLRGSQMAVHAEAINQHAPSTEREKSKRRERMFYTGMSIAFLITVVAGFSRTYFLRPY